MNKHWRKFCFLSCFLVCEIGYAFDTMKMAFGYNSQISKDVVFNFKGHKPEKPINVLKDAPNDIPEDTKKVVSVFREMHKVNSEGSKKDALMLWEKSLRATMSEEFSEEYFLENQARFKEFTAIRLHLVIDYDDVLICYISYDSDNKDDDWIILAQLVKTEEGLMMTNRLDKDHFFKHIAPNLLTRNMELASAVQ